MGASEGLCTQTASQEAGSNVLPASRLPLTFCMGTRLGLFLFFKCPLLLSIRKFQFEPF